jgi:hypothetical protein
MERLHGHPAGRLGLRHVGHVDRVLPAVVDAEGTVAVGVRRFHVAPELPEGVAPVDRHRDLRERVPGPAHRSGEDPGRPVILTGDELVGRGRQPEHAGYAGVVDAIHPLVVEALRKVGVEHLLGGLQAHPLVHERTTADTGAAQDVHPVAPDPFEEAGEGLAGG